MNIGIFADTYYPQINGVVTSTLMLKKELEKKGHKVYIITTSDPNAKEAEPEVFRLPSMPFVFLPTHRMCLIYPPQTILKLGSLHLDIVHTQTEFSLGIFGKMVSEFFRIPQVHTYHTMYVDYVHYVAKGRLITPKMAKQYSRIFCNRAKAIIAPVEKAKDSLLSYGVVRPIKVIPTGIDFEPFSREKYSKEEMAALRNEFGLKEDDKVVVTVGRVAKEKSMDVIMRQFPELLKKLPNAKFVVVGGGPLLNELKKMAEDDGVSSSVVFAGFRPWSEIGKYYQLGDVFVSASTSETQGLTYIEAMAAKVLVVAKRDKSVEGVIEHGVTGYYFDNEEELSDVLCTALTDTEKSKEITITAYQRIQHLSSIHFAYAVEKLYEEVIESSPKKRVGQKIKLKVGKFFKK